MKNSIAAVFCCFLSLCSVSQQKSFLVMHSGDTLFSNAIQLSGKYFTAADFSSPVNADEVYKANVNGREAVVLHCVLQLYTDNINSLERSWVNLASADTVLYLNEIYRTPKMNLYFATDNSRAQYYFYKTPADKVPVQLVVRYNIGGGLTAYGNDPGAYKGQLSITHLAEDKGYVNQLRFIMKDCKKIPEGMWDVLQYRGFSFKKLIKTYNKCK
jgi:hypothetical protein